MGLVGLVGENQRGLVGTRDVGGVESPAPSAPHSAFRIDYTGRTAADCSVPTRTQALQGQDFQKWARELILTAATSGDTG